MADSGELDLASLQAAVQRQKEQVREMKKEGAGSDALAPVIAQLKEMKEALEQAVKREGTATWDVNKAALDDTMIRRMFVVPSFEIYGGVAGLYDFGPPGCALKDNLLAFWRQHFVLEDGMLQVECTTLTPKIVLETSGHEDLFVDLMVKDPSNGECFRADKLLEDHIDRLLEDPELLVERREELKRIARQADAYNKDELHAHIQELGIMSPSSNKPLSEPFAFNLMFETRIGPEGTLAGYLRPETAQGIFMNFRRLLDYNGGKIPFAAAQTGLAFRNEIAPRNGLLRVREFTMAEIEHFVNPNDKSHPKFDQVRDTVLTLFPADKQLGDGKTVAMTIGQAVDEGAVANETLGYFMARTHSFLRSVGIKSEGLRFRQHLRTEMAHYAADCWDAEVLMSSGWVEVVGHADRACYDLEVHAKRSRVTMEAVERLSEPRTIEVVLASVNKKDIGKALRKEAKPVMEYLAQLAEDHDAAMSLEEKLNTDGEATITVADGREFAIHRNMVSFTRTTKQQDVVSFTPSVVEPSFGIGRVINGIFEHCFYIRDGDEQRGVMGLPPVVAPVKCTVFPLDGRIDKAWMRDVQQNLTRRGISNIADETGVSIGRRYARTDEIGVPFAITIDFQTMDDKTVTVRERDSMAQIRVSLDHVYDLISDLCSGGRLWGDVLREHELVATGEDKTPVAGAGAS